MANFVKMVEYFTRFPKNLERSAGKFLTRSLGDSSFEGCTREQIIQAKKEARQALLDPQKSQLPLSESPKTFISTKHNEDKSITGEAIVSTRVSSLEDLLTTFSVDSSVYRVVSWECNVWETARKDKKVLTHYGDDGVPTLQIQDSGKMFVQPLYQVKAKFAPIKEDSADFFQVKFKEFLSGYKPESKPVPPPDFNNTTKACLIIPKQDAHFNKYDVYGSNDIQERFDRVRSLTVSHVVKAKSYNDLDQIVYVIGGDQFNSEFTNATTKGTPQTNISNYEGSFQMICDHEVNVINDLLSSSAQVRVVYVPGNHDHFVGWHCINWLVCYYRNEPRIVFDSSNLCTKYYRYNNSAFMFNHGDALKFKDLAIAFPIGFKDEWSFCEHFYVFTGDRHTEHSKDIGGIRVYQVPQLGSATSSWDDKRNYGAKPELQSFLIDSVDGNTDIYKNKLR